MASDGQAARRALWARYDAGELSPAELDARLKAVDRAGDDAGALGRAVDGPVRVPSPARRRALTAVGAVVVAVALIGGLVTALAGEEAPSPRDPRTAVTIGGPIVNGVPAGPVDCPEVDERLAQFDAIDQETPPANPALLSDPAALPDGYQLGDEEEIAAGTDPDIAMSVSAGTPAPVTILARTLTGPLSVTMRAWVYESADAAGAAGEDVLRQGVCSYGIDPFDVPDRPDIFGSTVSGVIPTTAFASWRLAERRFTVAVQAGADGDPDATAAAEQLAGVIAGLELDAARSQPPPG